MTTTIVRTDLNSDVAGASGDLEQLHGDSGISVVISSGGVTLPTYCATARIDDPPLSIELEDAEFVAACRQRLARQLADES